MWSRPREITTENARFLPRFQSLCERFGFLPVYLTNFEMAECPRFREFAQDLLRRGTGEIGMHLHAWNQPPIVPLTADDLAHQPFLMEYPEAVMREKVNRLTGLLEDRFGVKMHSHRAGRWGLSPAYARTLIDQGYTVDCSVTPGVDWSSNLGDPAGRGGSDYTGFPDTAYELDPSDLRRPGTSGLLEVPMTVLSLEPEPVRWLAGRLPARSLPAKILRRFYPPLAWLRPEPGNRRRLLRVLDQAAAEKREFVEFMLHSSEFMPGGSPTFPDAASIEALYEDMEALFAHAARSWKGQTLAGFAADWKAARSRRLHGAA
jgi:hypothetical protein